MYEELIERLRDAHGGTEGIKMCADAADAIEKLEGMLQDSFAVHLLGILDRKEAELEQVKRERDSAKEELRKAAERSRQ